MPFIAGRANPNLGAAAREARAAQQARIDLRNAAADVGASARRQRADQDQRIASRKAERDAAIERSKLARQANGIGVDPAKVKQEAEEQKKRKGDDAGSIRFRQAETDYDRKVAQPVAKAPPVWKAEALFGFGDGSEGGEDGSMLGSANPPQGWQRGGWPTIRPYRGATVATGNPAAPPRGRR